MYKNVKHFIYYLIFHNYPVPNFFKEYKINNKNILEQYVLNINNLLLFVVNSFTRVFCYEIKKKKLKSVS